MSRSIALAPALAPLLRLARTGFRPAAPARPRRPAAGAALPVIEETAAEREAATHEAQGLFLARQERWDELDTLVRSCDRRRAALPDGQPVAQRLALGAASDVLWTAEAGFDTDERMRRTGCGVAQLEDALAAHPRAPGVALVLVHTHLSLGWAARREAATEPARPEARAALHAHLARAGQILDRFAEAAGDSAAFAAARCLQLPARRPGPEARARAYLDLVARDPANPRHLRDMGRSLLPRRTGTLATLERAAREAAALSEAKLGPAGYFWAHMDALAEDERVFERLDLEWFLAGLDAAAARHGDQHAANTVAAFCALTMAPHHGRARLNPAIAPRRAAVHDRAPGVCRDHLHEIHPLVWAETAAAIGPERPVPPRPRRVAEGTALARAALAAA